MYILSVLQNTDQWPSNGFTNVYKIDTCSLLSVVDVDPLGDVAGESEFVSDEGVFSGGVVAASVENLEMLPETNTNVNKFFNCLQRPYFKFT